MIEETLSVDFETHYSSEYSLSKMTTAEYILDPRFEIIGVSVGWNDQDPEWFSGTLSEVVSWLSQFPFDEEGVATIVQNAFFDGAILEWMCGIRPWKYFCTRLAANAVIGMLVRSVSLANQAKFHKLPEKGHEVIAAKGLRRSDFTPVQLARYANYCMHDTELAFQLFERYEPKLSEDEQDLIDLTIKKFTRPRFMLDRAVLQTRLTECQNEKAIAIFKSGFTPDELSSAGKFKQALENLGYECPMKKSPTNPDKMIPALAKNDEGMRQLMEHEDTHVQAIAAARLKVKSTIEESRLERFLDQQALGRPLAVPLNYYAAHTGRFGGTDKLNLQNLPRGGALRRSLIAPEGHVVVAGDLSQIEARITAVLSGCDLLLGAFARGEDVYKQFASILYNKFMGGVTSQERFVGKTCILGLGYGMSWKAFAKQMSIAGVEMTENEYRSTIRTYRNTYHEIPRLWDFLDTVIRYMIDEDAFKSAWALSEKLRSRVHDMAVLQQQIMLPNGMYLKYPELKTNIDEDGRHQWVYNVKQRYWAKLYGGKLCENIVQALSRIVVSEAELRMTRLSNHDAFRSVLQVHDELVYIVRDEQAEKFAKVLHRELTRAVPWMPSLPVAAEVGIGRNYADAK